MGSSTEARRRDRQSPHQPLCPPEHGVIVPLVEINPEVHTEASVGDPVTLESQYHAIAADTDVGRLGRVSPRYQGDVLRRALIRGTVWELGEDPVTVEVCLYT